jgi:hypothetical protein
MPQRKQEEKLQYEDYLSITRRPKITEEMKSAFLKEVEKHWSGERPTAKKSDIQKFLRKSVEKEKRKKFALEVAKNAFEVSPAGLGFNIGQKLGKALKRRMKSL